MVKDQRGLELIGANASAVDLFDEAVSAFNFFRGDPIGLLDRALTESPTFAMAHLGKAALFALATEPAATAEAKRLLAEIGRFETSDREVSFSVAIEHLVSGNWTLAAVTLDHHLLHYPHDLLAIQVGHLIDFFRASPRGLRDRLARILPFWDAATPGYSVLLGMYAFGLEEAGDYAKAEALGREAVERDARDSWAHHAVAHVFEMQGRSDEGIRWMHDRESHWASDDSFFKVHNWWHLSLYHLDREEVDEALALYDGPVRGEKSQIAVNQLDASALLWRIWASSGDVGDRWVELANSWDANADGQIYPFNDFHAVMAWLGAGQLDKVHRLLATYRKMTGEREVERWAISHAIALVDGFLDFTMGDYDDAISKLHSARHITDCFGGSHAQRDVIDWTLMEAAIRNGNAQAAEAFAQERLAVKPHTPVNLSFLKRARSKA